MNRLGYTCLFVRDVPDTVKFYEHAFGLSLKYMHPTNNYAEMETGETMLAFTAEAMVDGMKLINGIDYVRNRSDEKPIGAQLAFISTDLEASLRQALEAGAEIVTGPDAKPWGQTLAYVRDNNGVLVEITTPPTR